MITVITMYKEVAFSRVMNVQSPLRKEISKAKHDCKFDEIPNNSSEELLSLTVITTWQCLLN